MKKLLLIILVAATACNSNKQKFQIFADAIKNECEVAVDEIDKINTVYISVDSITPYRQKKMQICDSLIAMRSIANDFEKPQIENLLYKKLDSLTLAVEKDNKTNIFYHIQAIVQYKQKDGNTGVITHTFNYPAPINYPYLISLSNYLMFDTYNEAFEKDKDIKGVPITEIGEEHFKTYIANPALIKYTY